MKTNITVMLLGSVDSKGCYSRCLIVPASISPDVARAKFIQVIDSVKLAHPDDWTWDEDIEPALEDAGFLIPNWFHGPIWDA